jgi:outer membrane protein TolC
MEADALVAAARDRRPERAAVARRVEALSARREAVDARSKPNVSVAGGFDYARPNPRILPRQDLWKTSWDVNVGVSWSLFDGGRREADLARADWEARAAEHRLVDLDTAIALDVRQRRLDLETALASIAAADAGVRAAAEARRVVSDRFGAGVATSTDVLDAQVALLQAELERTRARVSAHVAAARLRRAAGG